jgi:hypothetical protein
LTEQPKTSEAVRVSRLLVGYQPPTEAVARARAMAVLLVPETMPRFSAWFAN